MKFEKLEKNYAKFTFEVTSEEFEHGLDHAFLHIKDKVEVKGFRKGHVPRNIYDQKFGVESLYEDALNHVIGHLYDQVFTEKSVVIVAGPKVDVDFNSIKVGEPFELSLTFPIKPEVVLGNYTGLEVAKRDLEVTDKEVDNKINELLTQNKTLMPKEEGNLEEGDTAIFDFEGFLEDVPFEGGKAENHQLVIGSNSFIPGFEEQMIGMKVGEEKDLNVTFPEEYHAEDLKGKAVVFKVKLHEIKVSLKEELTDDFVKTLNKDNVNTIEELKENIKQEIKISKEANEKNRIIGSAVKNAVDNAKVDIPKEMIDAEKDNMYKQTESQAKQYGIEMEMYLQFSGMTTEEYMKSLEKQANERVLTSLVIEAIAEKENFEVTDEEKETKYEEIAKQYNMEVEKVKEQLEDDVITNEVRFQKAIDFLEASVKEI